MQVLKYRGLGGAPQNLVVGADSLIGTAAAAEDPYPYWWEKPGRSSDHVQKVKSIPAPPNGVLTPILEFQIPSGFRFVLRSILQFFATGTNSPVFVEGSGSILWTLDVDNPTNANSISGYPVTDLANMAQSRGSLQCGPWRLEGFNVFDPYQTLRYKVKTTSAIAPGDPNYITAGLFGWWVEMPKHRR